MVRKASFVVFCLSALALVVACTPKELAPLVTAGTVLLTGECALADDAGSDAWVTLLCPILGGGTARVKASRIAWNAARADADAGPGK